MSNQSTMSAPPRQPFGNITNNPASNSPASGPAKANNVRGATQAGPTTGPTAGSTTGAAPGASGSNGYEAAGAAWQKKTQAEKEAVYMKTFGSKERE